jgi:hypothetical protein
MENKKNTSMNYRQNHWKKINALCVMTKGKFKNTSMWNIPA